MRVRPAAKTRCPAVQIRQGDLKLFEPITICPLVTLRDREELSFTGLQEFNAPAHVAVGP